MINAANQHSTWKDEYALLVVTLPVVVLLAALGAAFGLPVDVGALGTAMFAPLASLPDRWLRPSSLVSGQLSASPASRSSWLSCIA